MYIKNYGSIVVSIIVCVIMLFVTICNSNFKKFIRNNNIIEFKKIKTNSIKPDLDMKEKKLLESEFSDITDHIQKSQIIFSKEQEKDR